MNVPNPFLPSEIYKRVREDEERKRKASLESLLRTLYPTMYPLAPSVPPWLTASTKRRVFVSYHHADQREVDSFITSWTETNKVFTPRVLGVGDGYDDFIDSDDHEYVAAQIRARYIEGTSVTIVLIGGHTHSRRHVDWEIKASLTQGKDSLPNGLLGILLPSQGGSAHLPPRFQRNWTEDSKGYARYHSAPTTPEGLKSLIDDAYNARTTRAHLIDNPRDRMIKNSVCRVCNITH